MTTRNQGQLIPNQENSVSTATCEPVNERRKTEGKKDTTLFLIVKMSVTLPQGHTENLALETSQAGGHILGAGRGKGQDESRAPGMFYPPGPTWSYATDADRACRTQPERVIELPLC